jgi:hypothetical protein
MTFNFSPWAIDGARTPAALGRQATYASMGELSGVVQPLDLRVQPLAVPGNGIRITSGAGVVLNHYLSDPDQSYVVSNPAYHEVPSSSMPPATGGTTYYLVCVVIGDPEYNQSGHPFMTGDPIPPEEAADFEYVRVVLLPCTSGTTRFEQLGLNYPGLALARIERPGSTTTITAGMITDVRQLARAPRSERKVLMVDTPDGYSLESTAYVEFPTGTYLNVNIPSWATHVVGTATLTGLRNFTRGSTSATKGDLAAQFAGVQGPSVRYDLPDLPEMSHTVVLPIDMSVQAVAGTAQQLRIVGKQDPGEIGYVLTYPGTYFIYDLQFTEKPMTA